MEAYNVRMLAISQNSYLLLDDAEVLTYEIVCDSVYEKGS